MAQRSSPSTRTFSGWPTSSESISTPPRATISRASDLARWAYGDDASKQAKYVYKALLSVLPVAAERLPIAPVIGSSEIDPATSCSPGRRGVGEADEVWGRHDGDEATPGCTRPGTPPELPAPAALRT